VTDKPMIGEFKSKPGNTPRVTAPPAAPPSETPVPDAPAAAEPVEELSAAERYRKRLADAKISLPKAHAVYDAVLDKGYYEEYVRIRTRRAVIRTRNYEDQLRIQTALENYQPRTAMGHDEIVSRYNLAASLYEWDGKVLKHDTDADFDAILLLIRKMPQPLVALLYDALAKFDHQVMIIFSEGATDSF